MKIQCPNCGNLEAEKVDATHINCTVCEELFTISSEGSAKPAEELKDKINRLEKEVEALKKEKENAIQKKDANDGSNWWF
jgi:uncharacterized Zn finger protein (UPF0148 family)